MHIVISPAKTLDFETPAVATHYSQPDYLEDAAELVDTLKTLEPFQISDLMKVSAALGELNAQRFQQWSVPFNTDNAKQALLAFKGDVYTGLEAESFSDEDFTFAQNHLRILSGLYGLLRPLDLIQPYRLEMGTRLANSRGKNLYEFWGDTQTNALNALAKSEAEPVLVNLASTEYFKSVKAKKLTARVVTPHFKDMKNGQYKMISFYAKKARGMMAALIIKEQIGDVEQLKDIDMEGYRYSAELSKGDDWVFTRNQEK